MIKKNKKVKLKDYCKKIDINKILAFGILVFNLLLLLVFFRVNSSFYQRNIQDFQVGKVAERTLVAEHDFEFIDRISTSRRNYELDRNITPVFVVSREITEEAILSFDMFAQRFYEYSEKVSLDELKKHFEDFKLRHRDFNIEIVVQLYEKSSPFSIFEISRAILVSVMNRGIIAPGKGRFSSYGEDELIEIWRFIAGRIERSDVPFSDVFKRESIREFTISSVKNNFEEDATLIADIVYIFSRENCFYDFDETQRKRERIITAAAPVYKTIEKGTVIIDRGFIVTEQHMEMINAMGSAVMHINFRIYIAILLYLMAVYFLANIFFSQPGVIKKVGAGEVPLLYILSQLFFIYALVIHNFSHIPDWLNYALIIPAPLFTMILAIIISQRAGLYFSLILSILVLIIGDFSPFPALFCLFNGIVGVLCVRKADTRLDLIIAGLKTGLFNIFFIITFLLFTETDYRVFLSSSGIAFLNGFFSGIVVLGILPIIELALNSPTRFRLIELLDLSNPILKKMHSMAPGTFNHSLSVGNLAEDACREIGANALLGRVGAYYHDIGKIEQAEYFIENQTSYNKHDYMKPSHSVSVIKSHVKIGIEKGKELRLPQALIDIIAQHHGNGLISYFYVKALKLGTATKIRPQDYSYVEGKPKSKEAAVVLLADNVEAAVRTLKKPTYERIDKLVWEVMFSKIETDQITESDLTFNELKIIKNSFVTTLMGAYHSRIEYPNLKEAVKEAEKNKKNAENNGHEQQNQD
ncbi:MAG: HDIG domain-containing protein [Spirochaetes bacterium]|nr:HDIG domain-containing protein [Spirochaetota bacterium]